MYWIFPKHAAGQYEYRAIRIEPGEAMVTAFVRKNHEITWSSHSNLLGEVGQSVIEIRDKCHATLTG